MKLHSARVTLTGELITADDAWEVVLTFLAARIAEDWLAQQEAIHG